MHDGLYITYYPKSDCTVMGPINYREVRFYMGFSRLQCYPKLRPSKAVHAEYLYFVLYITYYPKSDCTLMGPIKCREGRHCMGASRQLCYPKACLPTGRHCKQTYDGLYITSCPNSDCTIMGSIKCREEGIYMGGFRLQCYPKLYLPKTGNAEQQYYVLYITYYKKTQDQMPQEEPAWPQDGPT